MKRLPLLFTLLALIFLAVSATYWGMQLYKPQQRQLVAAAPASVPEPAPDAAATLFGGQPITSTASNYQLTGIVSAGRDSVAILVAEGQPPKALKVGRELAPGISVSEVHPRYVMLSEGGVMRRVDLVADTRPAIPLSGGPSMPATPGSPMPMPPQMARPTVAPAGALPVMEPQTAPGAVQPSPPPPPPGEVNPVVPQGQEPPPEGPPSDIQPPPPPPNQPNMPPPTRSMGSPVSDQPVSQ